MCGVSIMTQPYQNLPSFILPDEQPMSEDRPTADDLHLSHTMFQYIEVASPPETPEGQQHRLDCLNTLKKMLKEWVKQMAVESGIPEEDAESCGGNIFISGSFRLGVCGPGSDIDVICLVPDFCGGEPPGPFFGSFLDSIRAREDVTNVVAIPDAVVPMIGLCLRGVEIDLLISVRATADATLERPELLLDDSVLQGVDDKSTKALNGPRVTEILYLLTEHNYEHFRLCLRCLRYWSKQRGIYSNKLGYLGGVNFAILAAKAVQYYPYGSAFTLMQNVFEMMVQWKWPTEIRLTKKYNPGVGDHDQWDPAINNRQKYEVMPIITPAYPIMNSTFSVNKLSFGVMQSEFKRASELCKTIAETIQVRKQAGESVGVCSSEWTELFRPVPFFARSKFYLKLDIVASNEEDLTNWKGFAESRVRYLMQRLEKLPLSEARVYPKPFPLEPSSEEGKSEQSNEEIPCGETIYVGLTLDPQRSIRARRELDLGHIIDKFRRENLNTFRGKKQGMDIAVAVFKWKELPEVVFGEQGREGHRAEYQAFKKEQGQLKEIAEQERKEKQDKWAKQVESARWEMNNDLSGSSSQLSADDTANDSATSAPQNSAAVAAASAASNHALAAVNAACGGVAQPLTNANTEADTLQTCSDNDTTTSNISTSSSITSSTSSTTLPAPRPVVQQQQKKRKKKNTRRPSKKRRVDDDFAL